MANYYNGEDNKTVTGTSDNDYVLNYGNSVKINTGAGMDSILNVG